MSSTDTDAPAPDPPEDMSSVEYRAYIYGRRQLRRHMAVFSFAWFVMFGTALIALGLTSNDVANRIAQSGTLISTFFGSLALWVGAYWGIGAYEHQASYGGYGGYGRSFTPLPQSKSSRAD